MKGPGMVDGRGESRRLLVTWDGVRSGTLVIGGCFLHGTGHGGYQKRSGPGVKHLPAMRCG